MRISATEGDPGYKTWVGAEKPLAVLLNGRYLYQVVTADEEAGEAWVFVNVVVRAGEGYCYNVLMEDHRPIMKRLTGEVRILTGQNEHTEELSLTGLYSRNKAEFA